MRIFMKYKITALWVIVGMLGTNATGCDVMLPQNFFNIGFERPVEKFRTSDIARETLPIGNGVEAMEVKSFAIKGLNDVEMEYDESRKELRFKNKSISDTTTSTDYSSIDFNKITKLVFDGITLDVNTIMPIQYFLCNNCLSSDAGLRLNLKKVRSIEFSGYNDFNGVPKYELVINCFADDIESIKIDGKVNSYILKFIADNFSSEDHELFVELSGLQPEEAELRKTIDFINDNYYDVKVNYSN